MGVLYDYFGAADPATAVEWAIGPGGDHRQEGPSLDEAGADWIDMKGMDPHLALGQLIAFAEGVPFAGQRDKPELIWPDLRQWPEPTGSEPDPGSPWESGLLLMALPDRWRDVLAEVAEEFVPMLAMQWSFTDEAVFADQSTAEDCVRAFTGLARRARAAGSGLYCCCCP
ncbi:hypothetical protein [Streptomyces sp. NPDC006739]|uniref:hypothetical protein n=1 Tax=Streptomyces sp. NPDC006739 TaxID=3364763 RepID=UPI0036D168CC